MKLFNSSLLLLAFSLLADGAALSRRARETQQKYDATTKDFQRLGLCRYYKGVGVGRGSGDYIATCTPYCAAEIAKAANQRITNVGCHGGGEPYGTDMHGQNWDLGKCICNHALVNIIADIVLTEGLPMIAAMHCVVLFRVFQDVLKVGASVFPVGAASSAAGKAAIQAAKTIAKAASKADNKAGVYKSWYTGICGDNEYTARSEEIYSNMLKAPDSAAKACEWPCPGSKAYEEQQRKKEQDRKNPPKPTQAAKPDRYSTHMSALSAISKASAPTPKPKAQ